MRPGPFEAARIRHEPFLSLRCALMCWESLRTTWATA